MSFAFGALPKMIILQVLQSSYDQPKALEEETTFNKCWREIMMSIWQALISSLQFAITNDWNFQNWNSEYTKLIILEN